MVTGIEVASLALAAFPLIISALEHHDDGMQSLKEWIRFRAEFVSFLNAMNRQKIFFHQNLESLLLAVTGSEHEVAALLDDPESKAWRDRDLEAKLKSRLSGSYEFDAFTETVATINELLQKLADRLKLKPGEPHWSTKKSSIEKIKLEYEYRRITYILTKRRRIKLMDALWKNNEDLERLLGNSEKLEPMRTKRKSLMPGMLQQVREHAIGLHAALKRAWHCDCTDAHRTRLILYRNNNSSTGQIMKSGLILPQLQKPNGDDTSGQISKGLSEKWLAIEARRTKWHETTEPSRISEHMYNLDNASHHSSAVDSRYTRKPSVQFSISDMSALTRATTIMNEDDEIRDLCAATTDPLKIREDIGVLSDGKDHHYSLRLALDFPLSSAHIQRILSLDTLLEADQSPESRDSVPKLSRRNRISIAVTLAHSLLHLHTSPWLSRKWGKRDIFFFQNEDGSIHLDHPFVIADFVSQKPQMKPMEEIDLNVREARRESSTALLSLGIIILELWFNRKVESRPFRLEFLSPDGQDNNYTDLMTAMKWQESVLEEAGLDLHNATRRSIFCAFGVASQDLCDPELQKAVYDEVVVSLERLLAQFEGPH